MQQHLLRFCHVSGCLPAADFSVVRDMNQFDSLIGSISERLHETLLFQAGDDPCNRRLRDAEFPFQLLHGALLLFGFSQFHQNCNLHHCQVFSSQGVIRVPFQTVVQQFNKLPAGNRIRNKTASFQIHNKDSTLSF